MPYQDFKKQLEQIKHSVDLKDYAVYLGFQQSAKEVKESDRHYTHMSFNSHKIIIKNDTNKGFKIFSVKQAASTGRTNENGTVIDLHKMVTGESLKDTRKSLLEYSPSSINLAVEIIKRELDNYKKEDIERIQVAYSKFTGAENNKVLKNRGISDKTLSAPRFRYCIKTDSRGNAIFHHLAMYSGEAQVTGYEIKTNAYPTFSKGGKKGLWSSRTSSQDRRLVFGESVVDMLSYHQLNDDKFTRNLSMSGNWTPSVKELIVKSARKHPGSEIILAFDNDESGRSFSNKVKLLLENSGKNITDHYSNSKDWNQDLSNQLKLQTQE